MKVYSWGRKGWNSQDKEVTTGLRAKIPYSQPDFQREKKTDPISQLTSIQNEVQIGSPLEAIDNLPPSLKYVYQSPYEFYIAPNGKMLKVVDPVTQVYQYGEWGADRDEADEDVLGEQKNTLREYLERARVIDPESDTEAMFDAMEYIASNEELHDHYINQTESVGAILPAISDEKVEEVKKVQLYYQGQIDSAVDQKEIELLTLALEQKLDNILSEEMTLSLSSPFTANRYSQPAKRFEWLDVERHSDLAESAQNRETFFFDLFKEIADCNSMDALYGPVDPIEGGRCFEDGIMHRISRMYQHDKEICTEWSVEPLRDELGHVVQESALNIQAKSYLKQLRSKGLDEETIRRRMNARFFNTQKTIPAEYDDKGRILSPTIKIKDSWFHRNRGQAMTELFLTKAQWAGIYQLVDTIKNKTKFRALTDDEREAAKTLKEGLKECETLKDLGEYRYNAEKREFIYKRRNGLTVNTYRFEPSLIDRLSRVNEMRWWREVIKKHREIIAKGIK